MDVVGRISETERLQFALTTDKSELIAILGRRRIGKTFLIRKVFEGNLFFQFTGLHKSTMPEQLGRFANALVTYKLGNGIIPKSWFQAFDQLKDAIIKSRSKKKKVIFLDEFPWMATNKSRFLVAFTDFWNSFASARKDLVLIICGSSASWMIKKVLKNKGGLHNRVTERIILEPFTLKETKQFLINKNIFASDTEIAKLFMSFGGVPFYLDQVKSSESFQQSIDRLCFKPGALLNIEFEELFASLFENAAKHKRIIEVLCQYPKGLQRGDLIKKCKLKSGGGMTTLLDELEYSGFISSFIPIDKFSNEKVFRVIDCYTLFYNRFIAKSSKNSPLSWKQLFNSPSVTSWSGYAFENICFLHLRQIKEALRIDGIFSTCGTWQAKGNDEMNGAQIDIVINRADAVINLCEIKFSNEPFIITSDYAQKLQLKIASYKHFSKTRKSIFLTMITNNGLFENKYSKGFVQNFVELKQLFL